MRSHATQAGESSSLFCSPLGAPPLQAGPRAIPLLQQMSWLLIMSTLSVGGASSCHAGAGDSSSASSTSLPSFLLPSQQSLMTGVAAAAAQEALAHTPPFDEIKLRFNFGKNFFYTGVGAHTNWTLGQLQNKSVPNDLRSVFSNAVTTEAKENIARLESWLRREGFVFAEEKSGVSLHLNHIATNKSYALSFHNKRGNLTLRKIKSGNIKLAFGTLLCGAKSPDWRYKLLAQNHFSMDAATSGLLNRLAASAQMTSRCRLSIPALFGTDMVNDKERHKQKVIYTGTWPKSYGGGGYGGSSSSSRTEIKVTLSKVSDALTGQSTLEVAGTSPAVNELLQQRLQAGSMGSGDEQKLLRHLENIMAFARAAAAAMTGALDDAYHPVDDSSGYPDEDYNSDYYDRRSDY